MPAGNPVCPESCTRCGEASWRAGALARGFNLLADRARKRPGLPVARFYCAFTQLS